MNHKLESRLLGKASILWHLAFFMVQISHPYMTTRKTIVLAIWTFVSQVTSLLFNMLSLSFPSKEQASFNFMAAVTVCSDFRAPQNKICHGFHCSPFICHEVMGLDAMILVFWMLNFKSAFSLSSFTLIKRLFSSSSFSAVRVISSASLRLLIILLIILIPVCDSSSLAFLMMCTAYWASQVVLVVKNPPASEGDKGHRFDPWVRRIPWRRVWQPTAVF